jgi:hypothetical protein
MNRRIKVQEPKCEAGRGSAAHVEVLMRHAATTAADEGDVVGIKCHVSLFGHTCPLSDASPASSRRA